MKNVTEVEVWLHRKGKKRASSGKRKWGNSISQEVRVEFLFFPLEIKILLEERVRNI